MKVNNLKNILPHFEFDYDLPELVETVNEQCEELAVNNNKMLKVFATGVSEQDDTFNSKLFVKAGPHL